VENNYDSRMIKLAMVLATAVEAKNQMVAEGGIGEDINQVLYGWCGSSLSVVSQMTDAVQRQTPYERFMAVSSAVAILRQGWGLDAISMVAEGYVSSNPVDTYDKSLAKEFAIGNRAVNECITVTHVANDEISFVSKGYSYDVPKKVIWHEEVFVPGRMMVRNEESMYPLLFHTALKLPYIKPDDEVMGLASDDYYGALVFGLLANGFSTRFFDL
jgi:hypothetical protein